MLFPLVLLILAYTTEAARYHPKHEAIQVRLPLTNDTTWIPPPAAWLYGNWKVRYSSGFTYSSLYNFEVDTYPTLPTNTSIPAGRTIDLTSYQLPLSGNASTDSIIYTVFGYDYPQPQIAPYIFQFQGSLPGGLIKNDWNVLAWGYDSDDVEWRAEYETLVTGTSGTYSEPRLNVLSRSETGPNSKTYAAIVKALRVKFSGPGVDPDLILYARNITELPRDGRRKDLPPVSCDEKCVANAEP